MAYFISKSCGGLRLSTSDFTEIDEVVTSESMTVDTYTPSYSTGVSADFDADVYAEKGGKETLTFTAAEVDDAIQWEDAEGAPVEIAHYGFTSITGAVDGSTITVTYAEEEVPRTELAGEPFVASCGGIKFDDGVFTLVDGAITTVGTAAVASSFPANCSLRFDSNKFELGDEKEIVLA